SVRCRRTRPSSTLFPYTTLFRSKVHLDYHVDVERHYYSVPHSLIGKTVEVRLGTSTVEIFHRGSRVGAHPRSSIRGGFTTCPARSEEHTSELQSREKLVCRLLLE